MAKKFYAIKKGKSTGVFDNWDECKGYVSGYPGAEYKSFKSASEAADYINGVSSAKEDNSSRKLLPKGEFRAYTDGSFVADKNYSYAFVILNDNDEIIYEQSGVGANPDALKMANVSGELLAVVKLIQFVTSNNTLVKNGACSCDEKTPSIGESITKIHIFYDYVGVKNWATKEWKAKNEMTQWYRDFMQKYLHVCTFEHVKGHSGNKFNDRVDFLAKKELGI